MKPKTDKPSGKQEKKATKYKASMCFTMYEFAKSGHSESDIAEALGISRPTLASWKQEYSMVRLAMTKGFEYYQREQGTESFYSFVVGALPDDLVPLWDELIDSQGDPSAIKRLERMMESHGKKAKMRLFLHALVFCDFSIGKACSMVNIGYQTFQQWKMHDLDFARLINEVLERKKDFVEGALLRLVKQGVPSAVIHANKTLNADRGYSTKVEVRHSGGVEVSLKQVPVAQLPITLEEKKRILVAIRQMMAERRDQSALTGSTQLLLGASK